MVCLSLYVIVAFVWITVSANSLNITYECGPAPDNITIHVDGLQGINTYKVAVGGSATDSKHSNCTKSLSVLQMPNNNITLSNCSMPNELTLYLMEPRGHLENTIGVGKFSTYNISCQHTSNTVSGSLAVDSTINPTAVEPSIELNMNITPNHIHLGQPVRVIITEKNTVKHQLNISSCDATSADGNKTISLVATDGTYQKDLVKSVSPGTGNVEMILYGFRFTKDPIVNITCTVKICGTGSSCTDAKAGRDVETTHFTVADLQTVSGTFSVVA